MKGFERSSACFNVGYLGGEGGRGGGERERERASSIKE